MEQHMTNSLYFEHVTADISPKGVFIISHGMAEHMGRYQWLISQLNKDGFHVVSRDHKGHGINIINGETPGLFSDNNGWLKVRDDLKETINYAERKFPNLPCFLLGHSMGSWIALSTLNSKSSLKAIILTGSSKLPKLAIILNLIIIKIDILLNGKFNKSTIMDRLTMRRFNAEFKPNITPNDWISSDKDSVNDYTNDPLCGFIVTSSLWLDLCNGLMMIFNKRYYSELNKDIPILIMSGKNDAASTNSKLSLKLYKFFNKIFFNVKHVIIDTRHEIFTDLKKHSSYNHLLEFIKQR
jgi:alpha-beta hydrolase superfamily lysophospholipase